MADRFPLVANSSTNQIQEIPSGDTLDLSGNNVKGVGIITATTFSGNVTGNLTGNLTGNVTGNTSGTAGGLTGTPNITVGTVGCSTVTSSGDVSGVNATFSGNLTVQGTTTTIDTAITEVDSLNVEGSVGIGTTNPTTLLEVGSQNSSASATLTISRGEDISGGTGPKINLKHGPASGTQRTHEIYSFLGDLRIAADSNENMEFHTGGSESLRIGSSGEIGISGANYGTAGQVLTSQGSGSAPQWATPSASGISAGARSTNPNTTSVEWTSLPANIQSMEVGYADAYASTNNGQDERIVLRLGTSAGYLTSNYKNRSWNMYASAIGLGFNSSRAAFIPYYWIDNTDRATNIFILRRMGTTNTFQATWQEYIAGGHSYIAMGTGYIDLGAELTQVKLQTINGTATLNGSFWMNYTTR